nr:uncharacterized protein LOC106678726 isoform X2 [Halyomorpha halys]
MNKKPYRTQFGSPKIGSPIQEACFWYCLKRDPKEATQVKVIDKSSRSNAWAWDTSTGKWDVVYQHSFPTDRMAIGACHKSREEKEPSCVSYDSARSWQSDQKYISATPWNLSYNCDIFGFQPGPNGRYVFHIYSRNLHYDPWGTSCGFRENCCRVCNNQGEDEMKDCKDTPKERTQGSCWWLERKSAKQCPVTVNSEALVSPMEWSWQSSGGRWKVVYKFNQGEVDCSVDYTPSRGQTMRLISWKYDDNKLVLTYSANPTRVYREQHWKMKVLGGETWGFIPATDGTWTFSVYSRNVVIRPFERPSGSFNL